MNHHIIDAINKAFDDEVSRLFADLCGNQTDKGQTEFCDGMARAWSAKGVAMDGMRRYTQQVESKPVISGDRVWMGGMWVKITPREHAD